MGRLFIWCGYRALSRDCHPLFDSRHRHSTGLTFPPRKASTHMARMRMGQGGTESWGMHTNTHTHSYNRHQLNHGKTRKQKASEHSRFNPLLVPAFYRCFVNEFGRSFRFWFPSTLLSRCIRIQWSQSNVCQVGKSPSMSTGGKVKS